MSVNYRRAAFPRRPQFTFEPTGTSNAIQNRHVETARNLQQIKSGMTAIY
jgi:hypothetical protein